ncbi:cytochrome oxidase Cu insertion factor (SCO1/SenC/PrrC family) [Sinorhizobium fredii]
MTDFASGPFTVPPTRILRLAVLAIATLVALIAPAAAHSLEEVDQDLRDKERYFQAVDSEAPGFSLQDAGGHMVSLGSLRGKVVVLNFVYTNCPDVCPLHAERIAEIQKMVNQTPMKEMVEFVTITTDPKHDIGPVLRDYGKAHGLDPKNWVFMTSAPDKPEDTTRKDRRGLRTQVQRRRRRHADARDRHPRDRPGRPPPRPVSRAEVRACQSCRLRQRADKPDPKTASSS